MMGLGNNVLKSFKIILYTGCLSVAVLTSGQAQFNIHAGGGPSFSILTNETPFGNFTIRQLYGYYGELNFTVKLPKKININLSNQVINKRYYYDHEETVRADFVLHQIIGEIGIRPTDYFSAGIGMYYNTPLYRSVKNSKIGWVDSKEIHIIGTGDFGYSVRVSGSFMNFELYLRYKHGISHTNEFVLVNEFGEWRGSFFSNNRQLQFGVAYGLDFNFKKLNKKKNHDK